MLRLRELPSEFQRSKFSRCLPCPLPPHPQRVFACFLQREKHKLNPNRNQQINVRKVRTRREEWERRKMGIEFMSDAKAQAQAGSTAEDRVPRGFVTPRPRTLAPACPPGPAVPRGRGTPPSPPPPLVTCPVTRASREHAAVAVATNARGPCGGCDAHESPLPPQGLVRVPAPASF